MKIVKESKEERFIRMNAKEEALRLKGYLKVAGIDEVGRGPLAGPVCVAACILNPNQKLLGLNDSKKLSKKTRETLFDEIREKALTYSVKLVSPQYIDRKGINDAILLATKEALNALNPGPDFVLYDYVTWELPSPGEKIIQGDANCNCIAAASILAKVARDKYMAEQHKVFPDYGFNTNVGYGSKPHIEAILRLGPSPIHRLSYLKKILGE